MSNKVSTTTESHAQGPAVGSRVRAVRFATTAGPNTSVDPHTGLVRNSEGQIVSVDDNVTVPPGTEGTVTQLAAYQIHVAWDNGATLSLLVPEDQWELVC